MRKTAIRSNRSEKFRGEIKNRKILLVEVLGSRVIIVKERISDFPYGTQETYIKQPKVVKVSK